MTATRRLFTCLGLLAASIHSLNAMADDQLGCWWLDGRPGPMSFNLDAGTLWVPRDAPIGTPIGAVDRFLQRGNDQGVTMYCWNDGSVRLTVGVNPSVPVFPGSLPPINGEDVTGKVLQTNIPGIGVRIRLQHPFDGRASNAFVPNGSPTVPFDGFHEQHAGATFIPLAVIRSYVTLVKTGPIAAGPQALDGRELFSGTFTDVGRAFGYHLTGTVIQAQCSLTSRAVSADPVQLGEWDLGDFTGPGFTTAPVPFQITLNNCEDDPNGSVARAHIRLEGARGSLPIEPDRGLFSLTSDSTAEGLGIQMLQGDGMTPVTLNTDVPVIQLSPSGDTVLPFQARFYQTEATVRPGRAEGALNFTISYR
ncbi:fimbrial protein [Pseudomonas akapageensis]|uniref:fimbrial protein n=1 Tax=Pseudomonas akapageensis TaxID=2609961 RepID=UPI0014075BC9|nr:fimbrial protein [Pseudomonas akapageensis]